MDTSIRTLRRILWSLAAIGLAALPILAWQAVSMQSVGAAMGLAVLTPAFFFIRTGLRRCREAEYYLGPNG